MAGLWTTKRAQMYSGTGMGCDCGIGGLCGDSGSLRDSPAARELQKRLTDLEAKLQLAKGDEAQPQLPKLKCAVVRPITCGLVWRESIDACSCR